MEFTCSYVDCGAVGRFTRTCDKCSNKMCLSHYGKSCVSCFESEISHEFPDDDAVEHVIVDESAPPTLPNFLILENDRETIEEPEDEEPPAPVKRSLNGMPTMGYSDEQMGSLMNLITEHRVYVKSSKRFTQLPVKAKWEEVAKQFFGMWTKLKPLKGPGLRKSYSSFASAFVSYVHDDHNNLSAISFEPSQWQQTLLNLEEQNGSLKRLSAEAKAKKQSRENEILGKQSRSRSDSVADGGSNSDSPHESFDASKSSSKRHSGTRGAVNDIHDMSFFMENYKNNQERYTDIRQEELRTLTKIREEENRLKLMEIESKAKNNSEELSIKRMEAEARLLEARNKEKELKQKEAYDLQMFEMMRSNMNK